VNPASGCPVDTTSYTVEYTCGASGIDEPQWNASWMLFPNPASETVTIQFRSRPGDDRFFIYNAIGQRVRTIAVSSETMKIHVAGLQRGVYFVRVKSNKHPVLKFIKL